MSPNDAAAAGRSEQSNGGLYQDAPREMYQIVCAECGSDSTVPLRPKGDRPVYCSDCFSKTRAEPSSFRSLESRLTVYRGLPQRQPLILPLPNTRLPGREPI